MSTVFRLPFDCSIRMTRLHYCIVSTLFAACLAHICPFSSLPSECYPISAAKSATIRSGVPLRPSTTISKKKKNMLICRPTIVDGCHRCCSTYQAVFFCRGRSCLNTKSTIQTRQSETLRHLNCHVEILFVLLFAVSDCYFLQFLISLTDTHSSTINILWDHAHPLGMGSDQGHHASQDLQSSKFEKGGNRATLKLAKT